MIKSIQFLIIILLSTVTMTCKPNSGKADSPEEDHSSLVKKRREDGTLSSVNPIDRDGYVHGVKTNFYEDGKTIHSKVTYDHGRKHGPAIWYFKNGQMYEHTTFNRNRKNGLTKRYYESGELMEEITYDTGEEMPGKKKYSREGIPIVK